MNFAIPFGKRCPPCHVDRVLECQEWLPEALRVFSAHGVANAEASPRRGDEPPDDGQHATALQRRQKAAAVRQTIAEEGRLDEVRRAPTGDGSVARLDGDRRALS